MRVDDGQVVLSPAVEAGWVGWCMTVRSSGPSTEPCADVRAHGSILAERWLRGAGRSVRGLAVTESSVLAVALANGSVIPTRSERALPDGLRAVVVEVKEGGKLSAKALIEGGFKPTKDGRRPARSNERLGYEVRGEGWHAPATPPHKSCEITTIAQTEFHPVRGGVVSEEASYRGLVGRAFLSCSDTEYVSSDGEASLLTGMLVNAAHPAGEPGPLPDMTPVRGHPSFFEALGEGGEIVAKRIPGAWLVVASGPFTKATVSIRQRVALLVLLHGTRYQ